MESVTPKKPLRVLMIAPQPFLEARGTPISVYQRLWGLSSLGHHVDLVTYHIGKDVAIPGVSLERIPSIPFIKHVQIGPSMAKLVLDVFVFLKAFLLMLRNRYDIIHSHEEGAFMANVLKRIFSVRHVYDMHSSLPHQLDNYNFGNNRLFIGIFRRLEKWTLYACDALITVGPDLTDHATEINPQIPHVLIENLPVQTVQNNHLNGANPAPSGWRSKLNLQDKPTVVYTGNFEQYQGIDLLIDSAEIVAQQHPETVFVLVGGKPEQVVQWQRTVKQRKLNGSVRFIGTVPMDEVGQYSAEADILVSPRTDGLSVPLKIYTYLESGKPIVATKIAAHTLILNSENAILVDSTPSSLASGIIHLIRQPDLQTHLGNQARQLSNERYSASSYLNKLRTVYDLALDRGQGTAGTA